MTSSRIACLLLRGGSHHAGPLRPQNIVSFLLVSLLGLLLLGGCADDAERIAEFMERGERYVESEEHEEAIIEFKNVLQIDPENAAAHEALSLSYLVVNKSREAYWEMSETVRLDPENIEARLRYGTILAAIGDHDVALEQAEGALRIDSSSAPAYTLRAQAREASEDYEGAESDFRAAIEAEPDAAAFRFLYSGYLLRRGRTEEGEEALRELIDLEESFLAVSTLARQIVRQPGRDDETKALLERAVELAKQAPIEVVPRGPDEPAGTTSLLPNILREEAVHTSHLLLSAFYYTRDEFDRAIAVLEEGVGESESKIELIYQMARYYRLEGDKQREDALIRRATQESPDSTAAHLVLSVYLGQQGDLDGALEAARAAVAIEGENRAAQLREAELLVDLGFRDGDPDRIQAGGAIVDRILEAEPGSPEAHFVRAKIQLSEEDIEAAKESLETVLQVRPDWSQARFVLGAAMAASGDLSRARVELARAVELDPQDADSRRLLVKIHSELGEHEFAIEHGREYLTQRPNDVDIRIVVGQSLIRVGRPEEAYAEVEAIPEDERDAAAHFALGRLDLAFGRAELGAERLHAAGELAPGNPQVLRALLQLDRAQQDLEASVARVSKAVEAKPDDSEIAEIDAEVKFLTGDSEGAREAFERAVALDARNVTAQLALADLERRAGNVEAMIAIVERAAKAAPESSDLQYRLAMVYEQNARRGDAIQAYEKAISLNADFALAKNNLAYLLVESGGDLDRALELAQSAKEELPDDGNAADTLGWVLLKRGLPSAAIGYLEEAAGRFPAEAFEVQGIVRNHLAEAYEANREADKAIAESRRSIEFFENLQKLAKERDIEFSEPDWSLQARERIDRLSVTP